MRKALSYKRKIGEATAEKRNPSAAPRAVRAAILSAALILHLLHAGAAYPQSHISTQAHQAAVSALAGRTETDASYFSAGADGFLVKWTEDGLGEHYQVSDLQLRFVARHPNGNEIAVCETDGVSLYRISVWDWRKLAKKYTKVINQTVTSLTYSRKGSYIIIGTASVDGTVFLSSMNGQVAKKIGEATGIASYIKTSASEKSAVLYSPSGYLTYYNLQDGKRKARFSVEPNLEQVGIWGRDMFLTGVRDNILYVANATSGRTIAQFPAQDARLFYSDAENEAGLYYAATSAGTVTLHHITQADLMLADSAAGSPAPQPLSVKKWPTLKSRDSVLSGIQYKGEIIMGTRSGALYKTDTSPEASPAAIQPLTENVYDKIFDICNAGNDFYFLTKSAIFKSSYKSGTIERIADNDGHTQLIPYESGRLILWSQDSADAVKIVDTQNNSSSTVLVPAKRVQSLRLSGSRIVYVQGGTQACIYDIDTQKNEVVYEGTSVQDAILCNDRDLYIAKSAGGMPASALVHVDAATKETVALPLSGSVAFSLSCGQDKENAQIYGISVEKGKTFVFSFSPQKKAVSQLMRYDEEDSEAFASLHGQNLYTNIGKNQIRSYDVRNRKSLTFKRSASLPLKLARNKDNIVVLNRDGSVSWYSPDFTTVIADWYMTSDGQWFEF